MNANATESPRTVPTPAWLQRRMMQNLRLAARSRINRKRADKALEILAAVKRHGATPAAKPPERLPASRDEAVTGSVGTQSTRSTPSSESKRPSSKRKTWTASLGRTAKTLVRRVAQWRTGRRATPAGRGRKLWDNK